MLWPGPGRLEAGQVLAEAHPEATGALVGPGSGGGTYTSPAGDFSTLVTSAGTYTRTMPDGTVVDW